MTTRLIDPNGAQILPPVEDQHATVSAFAATQAANADHRHKHPVYAELAAALTIEAIA